MQDLLKPHLTSIMQLQLNLPPLSSTPSIEDTDHLIDTLAVHLANYSYKGNKRDSTIAIARNSAEHQRRQEAER